MNSCLRLTVILIAIPFCIGAQSPTEILEAYESAHNNQDIEASLDLYVRDAQFDLVGVWMKKGIDEMRELAEWDAALNSSLDFHIEEVRGDTVVCSVLERNDWFKAVGIDPLYHPKALVVIQNGLIHHIIAYPSPDSGEKVGGVVQALFEWSSQHNDDTIYRLLPQGEWLYSKETAKEWMALLKRWKG